MVRRQDNKGNLRCSPTHFERTSFHSFKYFTICVLFKKPFLSSVRCKCMMCQENIMFLRVVCGKNEWCIFQKIKTEVPWACNQKMLIVHHFLCCGHYSLLLQVLPSRVCLKRFSNFSIKFTKCFNISGDPPCLTLWWQSSKCKFSKQVCIHV